MARTLGMIGCQVLEDEMAHLVSRDPEIRNVLVIDSTKERTLATKIKRMATDKKVTIRDENYDIGKFRHGKDLSVIVWIKPINLHQSPKLLREEVFKVVWRLEPFVQSILLLYGQCGNAFLNLDPVDGDRRVPLTILKDEQGMLMDDCFGTVLGGRDEYRSFLIGEDGPSYVLNSMWAANWRNFMIEVQMLRDPNDIGEIKDLFKYMDYRRVVGLNTGLLEEDVFNMLLEEFSDTFAMPSENKECTLRVLERSYQEAKEHLLA
jgi:hypothetical protein